MHHCHCGLGCFLGTPKDFRFEVRPHCITWASFELTSLLLQLPKCWGYGCGLPCLALKGEFLLKALALHLGL